MNFEKCSLPSDTSTFSSEQTTRTLQIRVRGERLQVELHPWKWGRNGDLVRILYVWTRITSKTRRWKQGMYASAVITREEILRNMDLRESGLNRIKKDKTENMIETAKFLIDNTYGKGQTFPNMRGRYTVLKVEDAGA